MAQQTSYTDEQLLDLIGTERDRSVFAQLFKRHVHTVTGLCLYYLKDRQLSNDAVMDIFEGLLKNLHKYDIDNFKGWLLAYTRNHCLKLLTRALKKEKDFFNKNVDVESVERVNEEDHTDESRYIKLEAALEGLKPHQRECISLFYLKGRSYEDITSITGYSFNEVKSYIQNGKKNLKKKLSLPLN